LCVSPISLPAPPPAQPRELIRDERNQGFASDTQGFLRGPVRTPTRTQKKEQEETQKELSFPSSTRKGECLLGERARERDA